MKSNFIYVFFILLILGSCSRKKDKFLNKKFQNIKTNRTMAISSGNFDYLEFLANTRINSWKTKEIKIFNLPIFELCFSLLKIFEFVIVK